MVCESCVEEIEKAGHCYFSTHLDFNNQAKHALIQKLLKKISGYIRSRAALARFKDLPQNIESEDFTDVLLCHAKLYTFGHMYNITKLQQLAHRHIYLILRVYSIFPGHEDEFLGLVDHIFSNVLPGDDIFFTLAMYFGSITSAGGPSWGKMLRRLTDLAPEFGFTLAMVMGNHVRGQ